MKREEETTKWNGNMRKTTPNENGEMKMDSNKDEFELLNHVGMAQHWPNRIPLEIYLYIIFEKS